MASKRGVTTFLLSVNKTDSSQTISLVAFAHESAARLLVQYLSSQGIEAVYEFDSTEFPHQVRLLDVSQFDRAKSLCQEFLDNPQDPKFQNLAWQSEPLSTSSNEGLGLPTLSLSTILSVPITTLIFVLCLVVYGASWLGGYPWVEGNLKIQPIAVLLESDQWWRIITPALIHFSIVHIAFNLIWWGSLGAQIEQRFGSSLLFLLFIFSATTSNLAQLWTDGSNFGGLSGVVYAIVGFVWFIGWLRPHWGLSLPKPVIGFLLAWLLFGYLDLLWVQMANTAHTVGLISGCLSALLVVRLRSPNQTT